jgi:hypothetical protein
LGTTHILAYTTYSQHQKLDLELFEAALAMTETKTIDLLPKQVISLPNITKINRIKCSWLPMTRDKTWTKHLNAHRQYKKWEPAEADSGFPLSNLEWCSRGKYSVHGCL